MSLLLRRSGHDVLAASTGQQALEMTTSSLPDLIVSDIRMSEMDGWELFRRIRLQPGTATIPFIFLTSISAAPERVRGLRLGADDFISKPFHCDEMVARIDKCLDRQRRRDSDFPLAGIFGKVGHLSLIDIVQIMEMNRRSALITIRRGADVGKIYLREGALEGTSINGVFNPRRFYSILLWEDATFVISDLIDEVPADQRNALPVSELILQGAQNGDESQR